VGIAYDRVDMTFGGYGYRSQRLCGGS